MDEGCKFSIVCFRFWQAKFGREAGSGLRVEIELKDQTWRQAFGQFSGFKLVPKSIAIALEDSSEKGASLALEASSREVKEET